MNKSLVDDRRLMVESFDADGSRRAKIERDHGGLPAMPESCDHCLTVLERDYFRAALARAAFVAERLMQMIDRETWRATGGDDGQGHYEGDYREEQTHAEILAWKAMAE